MLLKIDVKPEDIIHNDKGSIVIKLHYYTAFAMAAYLVTAHGYTMEDFDNETKYKAKSLFVGINGGISLG